MVENGGFINRLRNVHLETSAATGLFRASRSPKTAKTPLKVHLRLRFPNLGKPRTAGLCGRAAGACDCGPLSVLKSNGLHRPKIRLKKFGFSSKPIPTNIVKKLPSRRCSKPIFSAFFNFSHKRPTFAFTSESGHTLGSRRKIAHNGSHAETGGLPFCEHSVALRCQRNTFYSTVLLYTYISRFSVNPHYQQKRNIRQSCRHKFYPQPLFIVFFNFLHKRPTFAFTGESGYTLGFRRRIAHSGLHGETGAFRMGVVSLPSERSTRFGNPAWPGFKTANFAAFGSWSETLLKNAESLRSSDALMRVAVPKASRPRWAA